MYVKGENMCREASVLTVNRQVFKVKISIVLYKL